MPARKIDFYLNSSGPLRSLSIEAKRIAELQQVFLKIAPHQLASACRVKQLRVGNLILLADNAAVAAKLKQLAPRLLTAYVKLGCEITSIRVEVQVSEMAQNLSSTRTFKHLSVDSIEAIERLCAQMEDSPLRRALANLAQNQRRDDPLLRGATPPTRGARTTGTPTR
jgi:hypothetical protein